MYTKLFAIAATLAICVYSTQPFAAETKRVCVDKTTQDGKPVLDKQGKPVQDCREIKVHKKLEGTPVPEKAGK